MQRAFVLAVIVLSFAQVSGATIFGAVRGKVRDAKGDPVPGISVVIHGSTDNWKETSVTDASGAFIFTAVPLGQYRLAANGHGFASSEQQLMLSSGSVANVEILVAPGAVRAEVTVSAAPPEIDTRSSTSRTTVSRLDIAQTPGAEKSNSLAMITDFVPGAYVVHDQLHVRGGHQVEWLIDGVPVPNTNIASNVGPQFDPKDVGDLEVQRGGYSSEYGDRTYGIFNVVPRTGFERNSEADLLLNYGSQQSTNDQLSIGDHSEKIAYYLSINGNRTNLGLETPTTDILHDEASGIGAFSTLMAQLTPIDQLRFVASLRRDDYEIPNDQDLQAAGVRDQERERDAFLNLTWVRIASPAVLLTVSPLFHQNSAQFDGGPNDPIVATDHLQSRYIGGQATLSELVHGHDLRLGVFGFSQRDDVLFGLRTNDGSGLDLTQHERPTGQLESAFAEDQFDVTSWLNVRGGIRFTRFAGGITETAASPRLGLAARLPLLNAVFRASYGDYYQAPPLSTVNGPLLELAAQEGFGFLPLKGERDHQAEVGLAIPMAGWTLDTAAFRTEARNFFDHDVLGNSNIFFPLTIDRAHIRGLELTLRSPVAESGAQVHVTYSHQTAEGEGGVVGGLTDFSPPEDGRFFLDHDQRDTLNAGVTWRFARGSWISGEVHYGSGFVDGEGPEHLPGHTTADLGAGTTLGVWTIQLSATNLANTRYLLDNSSTFGGTHEADPRQITAQIGYRFHY